MAQLRSGLRAYATQGRSPAEVLSGLSGLMRQLAPGQSATVLYMVVDPQRGEVTVSGAGHPAPILVRERGDARFLELPGSVPLGATRLPQYENATVDLEQGASLVLYSDGVVERPGEALEVRMLELRDGGARRPGSRGDLRDDRRCAAPRRDAAR